ncbi:hypothetical protein HDU91_007517, partial [Kappamyces sp. JEL0680]
NLSRYFFILVEAKNEKEHFEKFGSMNLLLAYAVAVKHHLRGETGPYYEDLYPLIMHLPDFAPGQEHPASDNIPLEISFHISQHISALRAREAVDAVQMGQMIVAVNGMVDVLSNLERIRSSPIPLAYSIHLRQTVVLYLFALPFQLVDPVKAMGWATIIVVALAAFTLFGIEAIGTEIEQPFGYDANDLRQDLFCEAIRMELCQIMNREAIIDSSRWTSCVEIGNFDAMRENSFYNKQQK